MVNFALFEGFESCKRNLAGLRGQGVSVDFEVDALRFAFFESMQFNPQALLAADCARYVLHEGSITSWCYELDEKCVFH